MEALISLWQWFLARAEKHRPLVWAAADPNQRHRERKEKEHSVGLVLLQLLAQFGS